MPNYWWPRGIGSPDWRAYQEELDALVAPLFAKICRVPHGEHLCARPEHDGAHECRCGFSWLPLP